MYKTRVMGSLVMCRAITYEATAISGVRFTIKKQLLKVEAG